MRFLVDLYRMIVLGALALALVGGSYLVFMLAFEGDTSPELSIFAIAGLVAAAVWVVLAIGLIATFISIHDRLVELADNSARIADSLGREPSFHRDHVTGLR
jgi:hypothetical protein